MERLYRVAVCRSPVDREYCRMEARRTRRRLLKPRPVAWTVEDAQPSSSPALEIYDPGTERPAPARVQLPPPGSSDPAVMLPPEGPTYPELQELADGLTIGDELLPPPPTGLTLVPSLAPPPEELVEEAIEAFEASEEEEVEQWLRDVDAVEVERSTPADGASESEKEADAVPMEFEPGETPTSLGVRLFRRLPPAEGLTRAETALVAALGAAAPLVLAGGLFLGWTLARSFGADPPPPPPPAVVTPVAAPEPPPAPIVEPEPEPEPEPVAAEIPAPIAPAPPPPVPRKDARGKKAPAPAPASAPAPAADPWAGAPVAAPAPAPAPAPAGAPVEDDESKKKKRKK
jgi:hypothetical protein